MRHENSPCCCWAAGRNGRPTGKLHPEHLGRKLEASSTFMRTGKAGICCMTPGMDPIWPRMPSRLSLQAARSYQHQLGHCFPWRTLLHFYLVQPICCVFCWDGKHLLHGHRHGSHLAQDAQQIVLAGCKELLTQSVQCVRQGERLLCMWSPSG